MKLNKIVTIALLALPLSTLAETKSTLPLTSTLSQPSTSIKLYAIDCGSIHVSDMKDLSSSGKYDGESISLVNSCFLIRHPNGDLLWDTGHIDSLADKPNGEKSGVWHSRLSVKLLEQLATLKMSPSDIEFLSLSHIHPDHAGNANAFSKATFIVNEAERKYMFSGPIKSYFGSYYSELENAKTITFKQSYDVFGDGSAVIKTMPGHTPGSSVLLIRLKNSGSVLLTGDLYIHAREREFGTMHQYNIDKAETVISRNKFEALAKKENAKVVIQHEKRDFTSLPRFPLFLD